MITSGHCRGRRTGRCRPTSSRRPVGALARQRSWPHRRYCPRPVTAGCPWTSSFSLPHRLSGGGRSPYLRSSALQGEGEQPRVSYSRRKTHLLQYRPLYCCSTEMERSSGPRTRPRSSAGLGPGLSAPATLGQELPHTPAPVRRQLVPEQDHLLATEVATEVADELDQALVVLGAGASLELEAGSPPVPAVGQRRGHRDPLPVEAVAENRGLAAGCPGAPDNGRQRGAALILEDDPGPLPAGGFLSAATPRAPSAGPPRRRTRWPAEPASAKLQPSRPSSFQT